MTEERHPTEDVRTWDGRERRVQGRGAGPGAAVSLNVWLALFFVGASLISLALVPVWTGQRTQAVRTEIATVLEPARDLTIELESVLASQMVALQAFLVSGEPRFRQAYRTGNAREVEIRDELGRLVDLTDGIVEQGIRDDLNVFAFLWHNNHEATVEGLIPRSAFLEQLPDDQLRYEDVQAVVTQLREALASGLRASEARLAEAARRQRQATVVLVGLALVSTLIVGVLARLLRRLAVDADRQRVDAVRVRREIDAVLEATGDGVIGVDRDGRCTFLNAAGAQLLGVSVRDALRHSVHDLVHGAESGCADASEACGLLAALADRQPARLLDETFHRRDDGSFPVQCELRPLLDGRRVGGMVLTFADLTESRETEQALTQAVQARDEVVAVVSHDLRGPVGTINAAAQLLLEVPLPDVQWREHVAAMERSSGRLTALIRDLLDVARIEGGALAVQPSPQPVRDLMETVVQLAVPVARRRSITVEPAYEGVADRSVRVDRDRILQVFSNLVDNAVRHSPEGGAIVLSAVARGDEVVFAVQDRGPGIPQAAQEGIFDRFRQLRSPARAGTGLGLAIVKGIVEAHGGRVWVESEVGEGSTFLVGLPAVVEDASSEPSSNGEAGAGEAPADEEARVS